MSFPLTLSYGKTPLICTLPREPEQLILPHNIPGHPDPRAILLEAVTHPKDMPPLAEYAHRAGKICIVIADQTRIYPQQLLIETVLDQLKEVDDSRITFIVGTGNHRSEERRVGKECRSRWSPYH